MASKSDTQVFSAQENAANLTSKKRTIALVIVSLAFVMDLLDSTIVNIAIPSIKTNLAASYSAIQWVVAGYSLAFALLLVTGGRMGDVFGYKKLFMVGIGGFTVASLLSGLSQDPGMLIAARLLQGSMAALMVPQVMSLMQVMYKPAERGAINGLFGALGGLSASLGPVVGGLLIKANVFGWDWRPIFLINVPIGIFGLLAAMKYLPNGKSSHPLKLDLIGTLIIMAAMLLLIFPLIQGRELGWPAWTFVMLAISVPVFGVFAWWQRRKMTIDGSPLVLPALFKNHSFGVGLGINMIFQMAMIGFFLTFGLLLQIGLGFSPIHAALTGIPVAFGIALTMATMGQTAIPKLGRYALSLGTIVMGLGLGITSWVIGHYGLTLHSWQLIGGLLLTGIGMGLVFGSLFAAVLNGVDARHAGSASGTLNAVQQVGGAIGVALIGVIFFGQLSHAAPASFASIEPGLRSSLSAQHVPATVQPALVKQVEACFVDRSREQDSSITPISCKQAPDNLLSNNPTLAQAITATAQQANSTNFANAFRWSIVATGSLLVVTFGLTFLLPARFKATAYSEA
jgi:EmrB/QacA subfamily drug resistance transporter